MAVTWTFKYSTTNLVVLRLRQLRSRRLGFALSVAVNTFALLKLLMSTKKESVLVQSGTLTSATCVWYLFGAGSSGARSARLRLLGLWFGRASAV